MNRRILSLLVVLMVMLAVASGCRKSIPIGSYGSNVDRHNVSADEVKTAIIRAGASLGWVIVPAGDNMLEATLNVRAHTLVVDIDYTSEHYLVRYKSSINLDYKDGKIHPQYRNWVLNLQRHVDIELATLKTSTK